MIPIFCHVIKNDIFTNMKIIVDMKSPKCSYKLNNNNKMDEMGVPEVEGEVGGVEVGRRQSPRRQTA